MPSHFLEELTEKEKLRLFEIFEQAPELVHYFQQNHTRKEKAALIKDKNLLKSIIEEEKKHIARLLSEINID